MKHIFSYIILGVIYFFLALFIFWSFWPYRIITWGNSPFPVNPTKVKVGQTLVYKVDYCKYMALSANVSRSFIDNVIYAVPDVTGTNPTGCHEIFATIVIPDIPPGPYKLRIEYSYMVNPIRQVSFTEYTQTFTIAE